MKRRVPALEALLAVLLAGHALAAERPQADPPRAERERDREPEWKRAIRDRLARLVSWKFADTPLPEAVAFLQMLARVDMILDPEAPQEAMNAAVTMRVADEPFAAALSRVLAASKMEYALLDHAVFISTRGRIDAVERYEEARRRWRARPVEPPEWQREIGRRLDRRVSFEFVETPMSEAVAFLQTLTKTTIILDPRANAEATALTLRITDMPLAAAFRWICRLAGLDYALLDGAVSISTPKLLAEEALRSAERSAAERAGAGRDVPAWEADIRRKLARKVSFEFVETPLSEAVTFMQTLTKTAFVFDPQSGAAGKALTLKVTNMPLGVAFRWMCRLAGVEYVIKDGAVFVTRPEEPEWKRRVRRLMERKASFEFAETPLEEAILFLQTLTTVSLILDPRAAEGRGDVAVTMQADRMSLWRVLERLLEIGELEYVLLDDAAFIAEPDRIVEMLWRKATDVGATGALAERKRLIRGHLKAKASFQFAETPFTESVSFLGTLHRMKCIVEPLPPERNVPITFKATNMELALALDWLVRLADLDCDLRDGAVFISTPEAIRGRAGEGSLEGRGREEPVGESEDEDVF